MGYKYKSWQEKREAKKARIANRAEFRKKSRAKAVQLAKTFASDLISKLKKTGFNNLKISGYSGVCPATVGRLMKRRKLDSMSLVAAAGLARAAGYQLKLVRIPPERDEYYDERTVKLSEVEKLKSE